VDSTSPPHLQLHYVGGSSLADAPLVNPTIKISDRLGFAYQAFPGTVLRARLRHQLCISVPFRRGGLLAYNGPNNYSATLR